MVCNFLLCMKFDVTVVDGLHSLLQIRFALRSTIRVVEHVLKLPLLLQEPHTKCCLTVVTTKRPTRRRLLMSVSCNGDLMKPIEDKDGIPISRVVMVDATRPVEQATPPLVLQVLLPREPSSAAAEPSIPKTIAEENSRKPNSAPSLVLCAP